MKLMSRLRTLNAEVCGLKYFSDFRLQASYLVSYLRPRLNPVMTLTRVLDFEGTTATLTGTLTAAVRKVMPVAITRAVPAVVMFVRRRILPRPGSYTDQPAQTRERNALLEPAQQADPPQGAGSLAKSAA
jgi:hypothetical protein